MPHDGRSGAVQIRLGRPARPRRHRRRLSHLHRLRRDRCGGEVQGNPQACLGDPQGARQPQDDPPRRRPSDYTKGIDVRLKALAELLEENRPDPAETVLVQLATPSRERVDSYVAMRSEIEQLVGHYQRRIRAGGPTGRRIPNRPMPRDELVSFFVAADVMLVTRCATG